MLLDSNARQRAGLSWFKPARVQLLAAPDGDESGAPSWSALVVDGVAMPYDEVLRVRMDDNALKFVIEGDSKRQHVRMSTRSEFNLWREALYPKIANPTLHPNALLAKAKCCRYLTHPCISNLNCQRGRYP